MYGASTSKNPRTLVKQCIGAGGEYSWLCYNWQALYWWYRHSSDSREAFEQYENAPFCGQFYSIFAIQGSRKDCSYVRPDDLSGRELRSTTKSTEPLPLHRSTLFSESLLKTVVNLLLSRKSNVLVVILKPLLHQKFREIEEDLFYMVGHRLWEPQGTRVLGMVIRTSLEQPSF